MFGLLNSVASASKISLLAKSVFLCMLVLLVGCKKDNPGTWPVEKVTQKVIESLQLSELELNKSEKGFEGTGKRSDGESFSVQITQDPSSSMISWDAKGDRGTNEIGNFRLY